MRKTLFYILCVYSIFTSCENNEVLIKDFEIKANIKYHNSREKIIFKNIPVQFNCILDTTKSLPNFIILWDFNDGNFSNERNISHIYTEEGSYQPSFIFNDGENEIILGKNTNMNYLNYMYFDDFKFKVATYPKVIGDSNINEIGKNIFRYGFDYNILYLEKTNDGVNELCLLLIDKEFNPISKTKLAIDSPENIVSTFLNYTGNIVIETENYFYEFSQSGTLIKNASKTKNYNSIISTSSGYSALINDNNNLKVDLLNFDFNISKTKILEFNEENHQFIDAAESNSGDYFVLCKSNFHMSSNYLYELNSLGEIVNQYYVYMDSIEKIYDNYIVGDEGSFFKLYSLNESYEGISELYLAQSAYRKENGALVLLNRNSKGSKVAFYSNMQLSSINGPFENSDENLYSCFGYDSDIFNDALRNDAGNFLILGTKQIPVFDDYNLTGYRTDLLLIEIDKDGNPVENK